MLTAQSSPGFLNAAFVWYIMNSYQSFEVELFLADMFINVMIFKYFLAYLLDIKVIK